MRRAIEIIWRRFKRLDLGNASRSVGTVLEKNKGIGPGFDQLRVGLSLSILFWHSFGMNYGAPWTESRSPMLFTPLVAGLLPMFFALSGFLVTGSAFRTNNLRVFITFRMLRILPALFTEISLSALVLGPLLTALPLAAYFSSHEFLEYFGSLVGRVRYVLPGLFLTNPFPSVVNGALWTVGPEIICYVIIALLILSAMLQKRAIVLVFALLFVGLCIFTDQWDRAPIHSVLPTKSLILCFIVGNLIFLYREKIIYNLWVTLLIFIISTLLIASSQADLRLHLAIYPAVAGLAYVVTTLGITDLPKLPFFHHGDYSYGIYIFGFPIQQSVVHFFPDHRTWWFNYMIAMPVTLLFAAASWHMIEKPALGLRRKFLTKSEGGHPRPTQFLTKSQLALAGALVIYGFFVAYSADVFPVRMIGRDLLGYLHPTENLARPQF
jgi:peptidoglycan/LPS O-acetylase OafA/YrhL